MMKIPTSVDVSLRIRRRMERLNWSVKVAAAACSLPKPTFEYYLYGSGLPGSAALACIAQGLETTADQLLFGRGSK